MTKQFRMLFLLIGVLFSMTGWAETKTSTLTFEGKSNGSGTADDNVTWTISSDAKESTFDKTRGIHYGTSKEQVSYLSLSASAITGRITQIVVNAAGASKTTAQLEVTVGGTAFGSPTTIQSASNAYSFNGSAQGEIIVKLSQAKTNKALYVKSIAVTYETSAEPETPDVPTPDNPETPDPETPDQPTPEKPIPDTNLTVASFIFDTEEGLTALGINQPAPSEGFNIVEDLYSQEVTISNTKGSTYTRVYNSRGKTDFRLYKGATLTVTVPEGCSLSTITFSGTRLDGLSPQKGTLSEAKWSAKGTHLNTVTFNINATVNITSISVSYLTGIQPPVFSLPSGRYEGTQTVTIACPTEDAEIHYTTDGTTPDATSARYTGPMTISSSQTIKAVAVKDGKVSSVSYESYTITYSVRSIAELKQLPSGTETTLILSDGNEGSMARVLYARGTGERQEVFIRDNSGAVCFYGIKANVPFAYNQHIAGQISGKYVLDNGLPKFCTTANTNTAHLVIAAPVTEADVTPQMITADDYGSYAADWVVLKDLHVNNASLMTTEGLTISNHFNLNNADKYAEPYAGAVVDISGIVYPQGSEKRICPVKTGDQEPVTFVIDQNSKFVSPSADLGPVAVRLNRTLSTQWWNTFCVPFDINDIEGATVTEFTGKMSGETMKYAPADAIKAGVPYLVKWDKANPTFKDVILKATPAKTINSEDGRYSFIGTYSVATLKDDKTERFLGDGDMLYWPEASSGANYNRIPGMRAYYRVPASATAAKIAFDTDATAIGSIIADKDSNKPMTIYNLNGQKINSRLSDLQKGIYIINGKKIIIK